jgi:hypothetical protein
MYLDLPQKVYDYDTAHFDLDVLLNTSGELPLFHGRILVGQRPDPEGNFEIWSQTLFGGTMSFSFVGTH